jgi:hypothetical protein
MLVFNMDKVRYDIILVRESRKVHNSNMELWLR